MKLLIALVLVLAMYCPRGFAETPELTVGAGSLEETLELYSALTGETVENCIWGMLRPFNLDGDDASSAKKAIAAIDKQFDLQQVQLISIAEKRKVAVWRKPNAINKIFVGDLLKYYALMTGKRVDLVQNVQFWVDPAEGGIGKADPVKWIEQALDKNGARMFEVGENHVVVSWATVRKK